MTVAFHVPPSTDFSLFDDVRTRLRNEVDRFLDLDDGDLSQTRRYHSVLASVHAICAAIAITRKVKKTLKLSTRTIFEKASPGDCAMNHVEIKAATEPTKAMRPSDF